MSYKLTTVSACRVADVDRQRFNEYVAGGDYQCAPSTISGRTRVFDEIDTIALFAFGRLIHKGMKPMFAGLLACRILQALRDEPNADVVTLACPIDAPTATRIPNGTDLETFSFPIDIFEIRAFNIKAMRDTLRRAVEAARLTNSHE